MAPQGRPLANASVRGTRNFKKLQAEGRVFCLDLEEESEDPNVIVAGTLLVSYLYAHVLFDPGATNSFISPEFAKKLLNKKI